jgi:hypothetical protein
MASGQQEERLWAGTAIPTGRQGVIFIVLTAVGGMLLSGFRNESFVLLPAQ